MQPRPRRVAGSADGNPVSANSSSTLASMLLRPGQRGFLATIPPHRHRKREPSLRRQNAVANLGAQQETDEETMGSLKFYRILIAAPATMLAAMTSALFLSPSTASAFTWTGGYVGAHGGGAWGNVSYSVDSHPIVQVPDDSFDLDGYLLGGQAGYNWQSGSLVFGIEGDMSWANIDGSGSDVDPRPESESVPSFEIGWIGTVRGRLGYAMDRLMVYGTGGVALTGVDANISNVEGAGDKRSDDNTYIGWTLGAGAEFAVTDSMSVKAEYLYSDFGLKSSNFGDVYGAGDLTADAEIEAHVVKIGVNIHF